METIEILKLLRPELAILIPVCWGLGMLLKSIKVLPNKFIPLMLCMSSVLLTLLYIFGIDEKIGLCFKLFTVLTQGVGYWAIAWVSHEKFIKMGIKLSILDSESQKSDNSKI